MDIDQIVRVALGSKKPGESCRCFRGEVTLDRLERQQFCRDNHGVCEDAVQRVVAAIGEPTLPCEVIVGAVRFSTGIKISTVLNAIQRHRLRQASGPLKQ